VGPKFHRVHHGIDLAQAGGSRGVNFAVLLPMWDVIFGTADFRSPVQATGIDDQLRGRDYGEGFLRQQVLGLRRMTGCLTGWARGRPG